MANRYWVENSGNWSNTSHWSATSGGVGGASVPTSTDNVYFDVKSFTMTGQILTIDIDNYCLDMDWTGALYNPTYSGYNKVTEVSGSLKLISGMSFDTNSGEFALTATSVGKTITTAGQSLMGLAFNGLGGGWTLQDDVIVTMTFPGKGFLLVAGNLNLNNKNVNCTLFSSAFTNARILTLGSGIITCSSDCTFATTTGLIFNAGTSTIKLTGNTKNFNGGNLTFNNVEFQGTSNTITGSNTFNDLKLTSGKTVNFTAGTTQTINSLSGDGILGNLITVQSTASGIPFMINKLSGTVKRNFYSIKDCIATGGSLFIAFNSTNVSGNTGWIFSNGGATITLFGQTSFDYLWIKNQVTQSEIDSINALNYQPIWDNKTLLLANYDTDINAGVTSLSGVLTGWQIYRQKENDTSLQFVKNVDVNTTSVIDAVVGTNNNYQWLVFPTTDTAVGGALTTDMVNVNFYNWSLTTLIPTPTDGQYTMGATFLFDLDVDSGQIENVTDVTVYSGFTKYSKISKSPKDYLQGTINCLMGYIDSSSNYIDTIQLREQLQSFINDGNNKLLKNRKGDCLIVQTKDFKFKTRDEIESQPLDATWSWIEVDSADGISVTD